MRSFSANIGKCIHDYEISPKHSSFQTSKVLKYGLFLYQVHPQLLSQVASVLLQGSPLYFRKYVKLQKCIEDGLSVDLKSYEIIFRISSSPVHRVAHIHVHRPFSMVFLQCDIAMRSNRNRISLMPQAIASALCNLR